MANEFDLMQAKTEADWDRFAKRAVAEGVGPLIHWTLKGSTTSRS